MVEQLGLAAPKQAVERTAIFVDIDGVLQPPGNQRRFRYDLDALQRELADEFENQAYLGHDKYDLGAIRYDWDTGAVDRLRKLCEDFGAEIVVSSDWRIGKSLATLKDYFHLHGLGSYVRGKTTDGQVALRDRAGEIREYLDTHPEIDRFVIFDDQYQRELEEMFPERHVHTGYRLEADDDRKAREILSGQRMDQCAEKCPRG